MAPWRLLITNIQVRLEAVCTIMSGSRLLLLLVMQHEDWGHGGGHTLALLRTRLFQQKVERLLRKSGCNRTVQTMQDLGSLVLPMETLKRIRQACIGSGQRGEHGTSESSGRFCGIPLYQWSFA